MRGHDDSVLQDIARLLVSHGGHYIFTVDGREFAVTARENLPDQREQQGVLPMAEPAVAAARENPAADAAVLSRINRDIALYRQHLDDEMNGGDVVFEGAGGEIARVRFEPLRGDLPPELQE